MIVVDASAFGELLVGRVTRRREVARILLGSDDDAVAPELADLEVASLLTRQARTGTISRRDADAAFAEYLQLGVRLYPHRAIIRRAWQLTRAVSAYDAAYVALAEALDAPLLTCDGRLARASGHSAMIVFAG